MNERNPSEPTATELLQTARRAAEVGGAVLTASFGAISHRSKGDMSHDLVTDADLASEKAVAAAILEAFPGHAILGEEEAAGDVNAEHLWIVDPLDGTTNYAHGIPHFAVSVAYFRNGVPQVGVVLNPAAGITYEATAGGGATRNGEPISVATAASLDQVLVGCGFYYDRGAVMQKTLAAIEEVFGHGIHGIRRMGTASLDLCQVACGMYGGFFEYQLQPWDFGAGVLIVREAGGRVTTCDGSDVPLSKTSLLASNTALHSALQDITARNHP